MALTFPAFAGNARINGAARNAPPMRVGERGSPVTILQAALIDLGYRMPVSTRRNGFPDGIYGRETRGTVHQFQTDQHLSSLDGVAGRQTFGRLDHLLAAQQPTHPLHPPAPPRRLPSTRDYEAGTANPTIRPDRGAGAWNSEPVTAIALAQQQAILQVLPAAFVFIGDDATGHMYHYFRNTGNTYTIDLEGMVGEVPSARERFENEVNQARRYVEMLPVGTHQITSRTAESGYNTKNENWNWYFAVGGYSTWGRGTARVRDGASGPEYELEFEYRFRDRYNWDRGKSVEIMGITITDEAMGEFHRQGLAREFNMTGSIRRTFRWRQGDPIPSSQVFPQGR